MNVEYGWKLKFMFRFMETTNELLQLYKLNFAQ
jgi:hypothetical protein